MTEIKLRELPLFSEMDDQEVAEIRAIMSEEKFKAGQLIIKEGDTGDLFYVVTKGAVEVFVHNEDGEDISLQIIEPGGFFGELSMLTNEPRSARVRAIKNSVALALDREEFFGFLRKRPNAAIDVLIELGGRLHTMDNILRRMASRNVNDVDEERLTFGQRIADSVADLIGSWPFIITQSVILFIWIALNVTAWINRWDPYPFILLNLALSFQAAYSGPVIMMSQNRQSLKDRLSAEIDHQVNTKAELEIGLLIRRIEELEKSAEDNQRELIKLLKDAQPKKRKT